MSETVNPFDDPDAWDTLKIAVSRDGKSKIYEWFNLPVDFDGDVVNEYDVKKQKGADGGKATDLGYLPAQFSVSWLMHTREHWKTYVAFVNDAKPRPGKQSKPTLVVMHPMLQLFDLTLCYIEKFNFPKSKQVDQWEAKLDVLEWYPKPLPVKPAPKSNVVTIPEITITGTRPRPPLLIQRDPPTISRPKPPLPSQNVKPSMNK